MGNAARGSLLRLTAAVGLAAIAPSCPPGDLDVGNYVLVESSRVSRTVSDHTYRARVTNTGPLARGVGASLTTGVPGVTVLDGHLAFGDVGGGSSPSSCDTFTVRHDRAYSFDETAFYWQISQSPPNSVPIADAGPDRSIDLGANVVLDGGASTDADADVVTYSWAFVSVPAGSQAELSDAALVRPSFHADLEGDFVLELRVSDAQSTSPPAQVIVTTNDAAPRAAAGRDQTVPVGAAAALDGTLSSDPDQDPLGFAWTLVSAPPGSAAALSDPTAATPTLIIDLVGRYRLNLVVSDGTSLSAPDEIVIDSDDSRPVANSGPARTAAIGDRVEFDGSSSIDPDGRALTSRWALIARPSGSIATLADAQTSRPVLVPDAAGHYVVQLLVNDGCLESEPTTATLFAEASVPIDSDGDGLSDQDENARGTDPNNPDTDRDGLTDGDEVRVHATSPLLADTDADTFGDYEEVEAGTDAGDASSTPVGAIPPDPVATASMIDVSVPTTVLDATLFLYSGPNPIQTGVAPDTIDADRAAVVRGRVLDSNGNALPGVTITAKDHPELGQTLTRSDGFFDLAINGGGLVTLDYVRPGYLPAQRQMQTDWKSFLTLDDVVLIRPDTRVTTIDLPGATEAQSAQGNPVVDADGSRQATVVFPAGTTAEMVLPDGTTQPLSKLHVRATEYTIGTDGPNRMPGPLPPTSGYTYAVDLSVDEALAAGAREVRFSQPVPFYVDNFLGFPVGIGVPLASYDTARGAWIPAANGRVIEVLGATADIADVDIDGDGLADSAPTLATLSITEAERRSLASLYPTGRSLWRVLIPHFSPWDLNWPYGLPDDAVSPTEDPEPEKVEDDACTQTGSSSIECQNQILGERVDVVGTRFGLHYASDRTPGRKTANTIEIPLTGSQVPASLREVELQVEIGGQRIVRHFGPSPSQRTTFTWDGKDVYGRKPQGEQLATVRIGYTYGVVYKTANRFGAVGSEITGSRARQELTLWRTSQRPIGGWDARAAGLGGWTLSVHHAYDPSAPVLFRGDGRRETASAELLGPTITAFAGTGTSCVGGDGGQATLAGLCPEGLAAGPDGSLYIATIGGSAVPGDRIRRVTPDGVIATVAGAGPRCTSATVPCGEGGPATLARLYTPNAIAIGPDESMYIVENVAHRVRKVGPDGLINTFAGTGVLGNLGDGGPAHLAQLFDVRSVAVGPDGSVYIQSGDRIRKVGPDGIITTVAGGGTCNPVGGSSFCGEGGLATSARLGSSAQIAVAPNGNLYILASTRVLRVTPDGILRTIAQRGQGGFFSPSAIAVASDETVYLLDSSRVLMFRPGGPIQIVAGTGLVGPAGDGGLASRASLLALSTGLAIGPDGSIYLAQTTNNNRVRRISPVTLRLRAGELPIASADGTEVYLFTPSYKHVRTVDAVTGVLRHAFAYDAAGRLASVTDVDGNVTRVERDGTGTATAIVGPFGQRTTLTMDASGYLSEITNPGGDIVRLAYTADGLLTGFTSPRGLGSSYGYDAFGRLTRATDPTGAVKTLTRTGTEADYSVTVTSPLGRPRVYRVERLANRDSRRTTTDPGGNQIVATVGRNGSTTTTYPDGTTVETLLGPDPRWGMQAPIVATRTVRTPAGRLQTTTTVRSVTLDVPTDLLSLRTLSETLTTNGRRFTNAYDATTRTFTATSPTGRRYTRSVDASGRQTQEQFGGLAPSTYAYDARGRLATATEGQGVVSRTTTIGHGDTGFLESISDALGHTDTFATDTRGRVTAHTAADGATQRFAYDANGNLLTLTPPGQPDHSFDYTPNNQIAGYVAPAIGAESRQTLYDHDQDRNLRELDRPGGQQVTFEYDVAGRPNLVGLASGDVGYTYDAAGRISSVSRDQGVTLSYGYEGTLFTGATWSGAVSGSVTRTHDDNFRVASYAVNGTAPIAVLYDQDGFATQVGDLTLARAAQSGLVTGTALGAITDATTYDGFGALATYTAAHAGDARFSSVLTRDSLGRITSASESIAGATHGFGYDYDLAGRLSEVRRDGAVVATYTYDANGNRLSRTDASGTITATYDAQDRLQRSGSTTYVHRPSGEIQSKTTAGQTTTYRYDEFGSLTGVTLPGATQIEYLLDGQSRRLGKRVDGTLVQAFLYQDRLRPSAELDGAGAVVSRFVYGARGSAPDYMIRGGTSYRIVSDHVGSPRLVIDAATGVIAQRLDYDAFGKVLVDTNPGFQPFGFAGGLYDATTGLVHFGARDYDADTGRWTTKDPIGFAGGDSDLYAYVANDPVNRIDPQGTGPYISPHTGRAVVQGATRVVTWVISEGAAAAASSSVGAIASSPIYVAPVAAAGTGTALAPAAASAPLAVGAFCVAASFLVGYEIGDALLDEFAPYRDGPGILSDVDYVIVPHPEGLPDIDGVRIPQR